ncbi:MAG TPA: alpha/beta family hydrolase [Actinomycetota bacterium]|nr:alpha/beta family hydrolase [Actinomycetota bacterium]
MPALKLAAGPPAPDGLVSAVLDEAAPGSGVPVLLTHGAGGDLAGAPLAALARGLAAAGHAALRFNLAYREAGRAAAPLAERSVPGYRAVLEDAQTKLPALGRRWAVGGKSYGGRVASLAVAAGMEVAGLVFYGYPLHPPGRPEAVRVAHWPAIRVPCLFLQGSLDSFCTLDLLRAHLPELGAPATLHVVDGGDHSLQVRASDAPGGRARGAPQVLAELAPLVGRWLDGLH